MIDTDQAYRDAISARERRIDIYMAVGVGIDNTSADDISGSSFGGLPMSSLPQITDANYVMTSGLATFEGYGIPTAPSAGMRTGPVEPADAPVEAGIWSDTISDADGNLDWTLALSFGSVHESSLTVYTPEVHILRAEVVFSKDGSETLRKTYDSSSENFSVTDIAEYDALSIRVLKVDKPFMHLRIVELEFGSSVTLSRSTVTGRVTFITEKDRTGLSMPLNELSLSAINSGWIYDYDSPSETGRAIVIGKPLVLSFSVHTPEGKRTVRGGRFVIRDITLKETVADITAYDPRVLFSDVYREWTIPASQSVGDAMDELCEGLGISHMCSEELYSMHPPRDCVFDADTTYMDDLIDFLMLMELDMIPGADGVLRIGPLQTPQDYGPVGLNRIYTYPQQRTDARPYNHISVHYGDGSDSVDLDLRADKTLAINQMSVRNPLVMTEEEARRILTRLASVISTAELEVEWQGDPALEVGDMVGFPGRWSQAQSRFLTYQEITFEGGMVCESRCVM